MLMIPDFSIVLVESQRVKRNDGCPSVSFFALAQNDMMVMHTSVSAQLQALF